MNHPQLSFFYSTRTASRIWTAASVDRRNLVAQGREHARPQQGPFWYRHYLDLLLIIPTWYAYDQLTKRGSLALLINDRPEDMFRDPLLIVVPALFIFAFSLLSMRLFVLLMRILDRMAGVIPWLTPHLALRQLGRQGHTYISPILLVIVSLALGVYSLSMAASLDQWLLDRMYHRAGADLAFEPYLESESLAQSTAATGGTTDTPVFSTQSADWIPPIGDYEALPGVAAAARVGDYKAVISITSGGGRKIDGRFLGIDRIEFPHVAWFRHDFARESLGSLMNRLAPIPDGILVSQRLLSENNLRIGDQLRLQIITRYGDSVNSLFTIVGAYEYFPTVYQDAETVIGNLEYFFSFFGITVAHNIWMRMDEGTSGEAALEIIPSTGVDTIREQDSLAMITEEQAKMERVGVFGTLSVSFIAAAVMAALGLLTYSYASLEDRRLHFAILRAGGLRRIQIVAQVAFEYAVLTACGAIAGVIIGSFAAELFIPMFRVTTEGDMPIPPLLPIIAQEEIIPLAVAFASIMIVLEVILIAAALYRRLFDALRVG